MDTEGTYLNINKPTDNIILNGEKLKDFLLNSGTRQGCLPLLGCFMTRQNVGRAVSSAQADLPQAAGRSRSPFRVSKCRLPIQSVVCGEEQSPHLPVKQTRQSSSPVLCQRGGKGRIRAAGIQSGCSAVIWGPLHTSPTQCTPFSFPCVFFVYPFILLEHNIH